MGCGRYWECLLIPKRWDRQPVRGRNILTYLDAFYFEESKQGLPQTRIWDKPTLVVISLSQLASKDTHD